MNYSSSLFFVFVGLSLLTSVPFAAVAQENGFRVPVSTGDDGDAVNVQKKAMTSDDSATNAMAEDMNDQSFDSYESPDDTQTDTLMDGEDIDNLVKSLATDMDSNLDGIISELPEDIRETLHDLDDLPVGDVYTLLESFSKIFEFAGGKDGDSDESVKDTNQFIDSIVNMLENSEYDTEENRDSTNVEISEEYDNLNIESVIEELRKYLPAEVSAQLNGLSSSEFKAEILKAYPEIRALVEDNEMLKSIMKLVMNTSDPLMDMALNSITDELVDETLTGISGGKHIKDKKNKKEKMTMDYVQPTLHVD